MVCSHCGDPVQIIPFIGWMQVIAALAVMALITPLLMIVMAMFDENKPLRLKDKSVISTMSTIDRS